MPEDPGLPAPQEGGAGPAKSGPERTCIGCRRRAPTGELVRVVLAPDGSLHFGRTLPGRGAWLCAGSSICFDQAANRRAFSRALRAEVSAEAIAAVRDDFVRPSPAVRG